MQLAQLKTLESARRVQAFFDDHATAVGAAVPFTLRARFEAAVDELADYQVEQELALAMARCETANQTALRRDIFGQFICPIGRIANFALRSEPEYPMLVMSAASPRHGHFRMYAMNLAAAAEVHVGVFVEYGMPCDFIEQLNAVLFRLGESAEARDRHCCRRVAATCGLRAASRSVRRLVGLIDGLIVPRIKRDHALLVAWISSRRIPAK
jgi:hypothetical protein